MSDPQSNSNGDSSTSSSPTATLDVTAVEPRSLPGPEREPPVSGLAVVIASLALVVAAIALHRSRRFSS